MSRANPGIEPMPIAIMRLVRLLPSTATMTNASRMPGKASITSTTRIATLSIQPP